MPGQCGMNVITHGANSKPLNIPNRVWDKVMKECWHRTISAIEESPGFVMMTSSRETPALTRLAKSLRLTKVFSGINGNTDNQIQGWIVPVRPRCHVYGREDHL